MLGGQPSVDVALAAVSSASAHLRARPSASGRGVRVEDGVAVGQRRV